MRQLNSQFKLARKQGTKALQGAHHNGFKLLIDQPFGLRKVRMHGSLSDDRAKRYFSTVLSASSLGRLARHGDSVGLLVDGVNGRRHEPWAGCSGHVQCIKSTASQIATGASSY
ncbi:hypothetical protein LP417_07250 [Polaromonas sp. P1-6]|nr:hypothetical protein LP417_07250 [Polaromonas sp. P1-6]